MEGVKLNWNEEKQSWDVDASQTASLLKNIYNEDVEIGIATFREFETLIKNSNYPESQKICEAFRAQGTLAGNGLDPYLAIFGLTDVTDLDDNLIGTANADEINGLAGNDVIYGGDGDDILHGGNGE